MVTCRLAFALTALLFVRSPAVAARPNVPTSYAILPIEAVNVGDQVASSFARAITEQLAKRRTVRLLTASATEPCTADDGACLMRLGHALAADRLVRLHAGGLGDTVLLRVEVFETRQGARQGAWQELLKRPTVAQLQAAARRICQSIAPLTVERRRAWYQRWWVWATVGAVVSAGVVSAIVFTRPGDTPDFTVQPR
ncbi:MAG: hypothetical protein H6707_17735 [Deltaproteobacteria bacterium]|nr:hypothetical protein [Deltaproteobacteria bacterium]